MSQRPHSAFQSQTRFNVSTNEIQKDVIIIIFQSIYQNKTFKQDQQQINTLSIQRPLSCLQNRYQKQNILSSLKQDPLELSNNRLLRNKPPVYLRKLDSLFQQKSQKKPPIDDTQIENLINLAKYSLEFNLIENSIEQFYQVLNLSFEILSSTKFLEILGYVVNQLNTKAVYLIKHSNNYKVELIIKNLQIWTQIFQSMNNDNNTFINLIRCPIIQKSSVYILEALYLISQSRTEDAENILYKNLKKLQSQKIDDISYEIHIGQLHIILSQCSMKNQNLILAIQQASSALTHLQSFYIQITQKQDQEDQIIKAADFIAEAYVIIGKCNEKLQKFKEASINYQCALIQQNISPVYQKEIKIVYAGFLVRQNVHLQSKSHQSNNQVKSSIFEPYKNEQPYSNNIISSCFQSGRMNQGLLKKNIKVSEKRKKIILNKYKPYSQQYQSPVFEKKLIYNNALIFNIQKQQTKKLHQNIRQDEFNKKLKEIFYHKENENFDQVNSKQFKINNKKKISGVNSPHQLISYYREMGQKVDLEIFQKKLANQIISPVVKFLENLLNQQQEKSEHKLVLLEDFQDIILKSEIDDIKFIGRLKIYIINSKNILYMRYYGCEYAHQQQIQQGYQLLRFKQSQFYELFGHSYNLSDVFNVIYDNKNNEEDSQYKADKQFAIFLREFILESCKFVGINKEKQAISIYQKTNTKQKNSQSKFYLQEYDQYVNVHQKNTYESIVYFIEEDMVFQCNYMKDIQPLLFQDEENNDEENSPNNDDENIHDRNKTSEDESSVEIVPLVNQRVLVQNNQQVKDNQQKQQKLQASIITRRPQQQRIDFDEAEDLMDEPASPQIIRQKKMKNSLEVRLQEKFTIQIASEDQTKTEVFEVYADKKEQAKLSPKKSRGFIQNLM